jgi:molybdopterin synthase sulfur carrier subunit
MATVRYFASARAAAGREEEPVDAATLGELVHIVGDRHGEQLALVLKVSSYLVDGLARRAGDTPLGSECTVDVLPPFAGG